MVILPLGLERRRDDVLFIDTTAVSGQPALVLICCRLCIF